MSRVPMQIAGLATAGIFARGPSLFPSVRMELSIIGTNFLYAVLGVVLMWVAYRLIDRLTPEVDFPAELKRGNVAVAIVIAAIFVSIAIIVGGALN